MGRKISLCGLHFHFHARHPTDRPTTGENRSGRNEDCFRSSANCKLLVFFFCLLRQKNTYSAVQSRRGTSRGMEANFFQRNSNLQLAVVTLTSSRQRRRRRDVSWIRCWSRWTDSSFAAHAFRGILLLRYKLHSFSFLLCFCVVAMIGRLCLYAATTRALPKWETAATTHTAPCKHSHTGREQEKKRSVLQYASLVICLHGNKHKH